MDILDSMDCQDVLDLGVGKEIQENEVLKEFVHATAMVKVLNACERAATARVI